MLLVDIGVKTASCSHPPPLRVLLNILPLIPLSSLLLALPGSELFQGLPSAMYPVYNVPNSSRCNFSQTEGWTSHEEGPIPSEFPFRKTTTLFSLCLSDLNKSQPQSLGLWGLGEQEQAKSRPGLAEGTTPSRCTGHVEQCPRWRVSVPLLKCRPRCQGPQGQAGDLDVWGGWR